MNELSQFMNQNLVYPLIFIVMCMVVFFFLSAILYYRFLYRWIPEKLATLVGFVGAAYILITCVNHYEGIKRLVSSWSLTGIVIGIVLFSVIFGVISALLMPNKKKRKAKKMNHKSSFNKNSQRSRTIQNRPDHEILNSHIESLSGSEFERLLALYFRDQGYIVHEVGIGGKDGGVDLVIIDQRGEKTAVQAKCYANHNSVGVQIVRELVGAKRNHDCILSLLVTTSDLTEPAKKEADQFKVDYWHGGVVEQKLKAWGKWNPSNKKSKLPSSAKQASSEMKTAQAQIAAATNVSCTCGAPMIMRKSKEGKSFYGCSTFPKCRNTKSISLST